MSPTIFYLDFLLTIVGVLLSVAFFTLVERKIMGLAHYRKGPTKPTILGLSQPFADALKLLTKEMFKLSSSKLLMYVMGPCLMILLMLICWTMYESAGQLSSGGAKFMILFSIMSLSIYAMFMMGLGSNSKYAMLGMHRAIAQTISYEVCMLLFILAILYLAKSVSFMSMFMMQQGMWVAVFSLPLFFTWLTMCLAESNRPPFDMAEGESEIVSGFNIEYGGSLFALIFISEYGMIILLSYLTSLFFLGNSDLLMKMFLVCMFFVWVRCALPRVRYDRLMMMSWKLALPYSLVLMSVGLLML